MDTSQTNFEPSPAPGGSRLGDCCAVMRLKWTITIDSEDIHEWGWTHCPWCKAKLTGENEKLTCRPASVARTEDKQPSMTNATSKKRKPKAASPKRKTQSGSGQVQRLVSPMDAGDLHIVRAPLAFAQSADQLISLQRRA